MRNEQKGDPKLYQVIVYNTYEDIPSEHVDGIVACGIAAFGEGMTRDEVLDHIKVKNGKVVIIVKQNRVVGFSISESTSLLARLKLKTDLADQPGIYLAGSGIVPAEQMKGLYNDLNEQRLRDAIRDKVAYVFTRTQNPRVEQGIRAILETFQKEGLIANFSLEKIKQPALYGRKLAELKEYYPELDSEAGDAYVLIFRLTYGS